MVEFQSQLGDLEHELRRLHRNITFKEERIKEMEERIREKEAYPDKVFYISETDMDVLEQRVLELENEEQVLEKLFQVRMLELESERRLR
jgi:chaperonin cofactor prefoldin